MDALASGIRTFVVTGPFTAGPARKAKRAFAREGFPDAEVTAKRIIRVEGCKNPKSLMRLFANPAAGMEVNEIDPAVKKSGIEVAYRLSVTDPETATGLEVAEALGTSMVWIRMGWTYEVEGVNPDLVEDIVKRRLLNKEVQVVVTAETFEETLRPTGEPEPLRHYNLVGLSLEELTQLSEESGWYASQNVLLALQRHQRKLGRPWTDAEIEMVVQSWGDHCFHVTWKGLGLFKKLKSTTYKIGHELCRSIFSDNAGAMYFYDGHVIFIKGETHNHPSSIYTKGGVETKHGGLLRDLIFMMKGGYPLGCSTIMGTRLPSEDAVMVPAGALSGWTITTEAIEGTASYCNPMGVPMMYAAYRVHQGYTKCLALGIGIGIAPEDSDKEEPQEGDILILIGGSTGRDGVHGATASSANLTAEMVEKEGATVQIGAPIIERCFMTMIPEARKRKLVRSVTDLGAGGLSCAVGEMVANCGAGISYDGLPLKDKSLASRERHVSESQERGLVVAPAKKVTAFLKLCKDYGVQTFVLGICRSDRRLVITDQRQTIVDLDMDFLWKGCPIEPLTVKNPGARRRVQMPREQVAADWIGTLSRVLSDYACCDQSWAVNQFDSTVQGQTVVGPLINGVPSDAFVCKAIRGKPYGAVSSFAFNPRWSETDPVGSVANLLAWAISRAVAIGVSPDDMVLCANWYTPTRTPEQRWYLRQMVHRLCRFTAAVGIPVVSGKDSSSGSYRTPDGTYIDVPPTLVPSTLGRMPNVGRIRTKVLAQAGDSIYLLGPAGVRLSMAGSVAAGLSENEKDARLPYVQDKELIKLWRQVASARQHLNSIAAIGEGGAFLQLFHGCYASGLGAEIITNGMWELLGENPGNYLISVAHDEARQIQRRFPETSLQYIGQVTAVPGIEIDDVVPGLVLARDTWPTLVKQWRSRFEQEVS